MSKLEWLNRSSAGNSKAGISRTEVRERKSERRTIQHLDGRIETIETVHETDVRDATAWGGNNYQLRKSVDAFVQLALPAAQHELPVHNLQLLKQELRLELSGLLPDQRVRIVR